MIVALAYSYPDQERVASLLNWIASLGPYPGHLLVLGVEKRVTQRFMADLIGSFGDVVEFDYVDLLDHQPESKNLAFQQCQLFIQQLVGPQPGELFLYLEPDAVPMKAGWLAAIENEAKAGGKPFTGARVAAVPTHRIPAHMGAVGVYPVDMISAGAGEAMIATEQPFPGAIAGVTTAKMTISKLIACDWEDKGVPQGCLLYHPDKEGKVLEQLKEGREVAQPTSASAVHDAGAEASSGVNYLSPEDRAGSNPAPPEIFPPPWPGVTDEQGRFLPNLGKTHPDPWENRLQSEESIKFLVSELKKYCTRPAYIGYVRKILKAAKVSK